MDEITKMEADKLPKIDYGTDWEGLDSCCCTAPIVWCDICSECKEHTEPACFSEDYFDE